MQRQRLEEFRALEDVKTPGGGRGREARFGRFVVFEDDGGVGDGVCFRGEFARGGVVWFLFLDFFFGCSFDDGVGGWVFHEGGLLRGEGAIRALRGRWWSGRATSWGWGGASFDMIAGSSAVVSRGLPPTLWWRRARGAVVTLRKFAIISRATRAADWRSAAGCRLSLTPSLVFAWTS